MASVWLISSGEYSDYGVSAVCATQEIAEAVCARLNATARRPNYYDVEEREFITAADQVWTGRTYCVRVDATGAEVQRWDYETTAWDGAMPPDEATPSTFPRNTAVEGRSGRNYDVALKAARDLLARQRAEAAGL